MYSFNCCFIPTNQTERPPFKIFIIHCSYDERLLIGPILKKHLDSLKATTIKSHRPLLDLEENAKEGEIPQVGYYRKCLSLFTL